MTHVQKVVAVFAAFVGGLVGSYVTWYLQGK